MRDFIVNMRLFMMLLDLRLMWNIVLFTVDSYLQHFFWYGWMNVKVYIYSIFYLMHLCSFALNNHNLK